MIRLTLLTRPGCHLCDHMKALVQRTGERHDVMLEQVDISSHDELVRQFGTQIPVLMHGDRVVARTRTTEKDLLALLRTLDTE